MSEELTPLLESADLARHLGIPPATLDQWAYRRIGPPYLRIGRHRRYRWCDVERWLESREIGDRE